MATVTAEQLASPQELADRLGISRQSVYRLAREGVLPHYRVGGALRFDLDAVLAALQENA